MTVALSIDSLSPVPSGAWALANGISMNKISVAVMTAVNIILFKSILSFAD